MYLKRLRSSNVVSLVIISFTLFVFTSFKGRNADASVTIVDALTAVGISAGSGALLGLSTTAFYQEPTKHMNNVLIGAGIGTIVGVGIVAYMFASNDSEDEIDPEEILIKSKSDKKKNGEGGSEEKDTGTDKKDKKKDENSGASNSIKTKKIARMRGYNLIATAQPMMPKILENEWALSMKVLELRF